MWAIGIWHLFAGDYSENNEVKNEKINRSSLATKM